MKSIRFTLRSKLLLLSLTILSIPWVGMQYVRTMEKFLQISDQDAIVTKANAISAILHEKPELFQRQVNVLEATSAQQHLYLRPLRHAIQLDGYAEDWQDVQDRFQKYGADHLLTGEAPVQDYRFGFSHATGSYKGYLYAIFRVTDRKIVYRDPNSLRLDQSDHLQIGLQNPKGEFERYLLTTSAPGWVNAHLMATDINNPITVHPETRIKGEWQETATGYILEIRIPLTMVGNKIAFAIANVDDSIKRNTRTLIGTSSTHFAKDLGTIVVPSPEIEKLLDSLTVNGGRAWLIDRNRRVLAISGSLKNIPTGNNLPQEEGMVSTFMRPIYRIFLKQPVLEFEDELSGVSKLQGREIESALQGYPAISWRASPDQLTSILTATHPVISNNRIIGAVMLEQTSNRILIFQNRAMENLLNSSILVFLGVFIILLVFATRLSIRITRLRNDTEKAISPDGRIQQMITISRARDEIGDMSRTFSSMLTRLNQYNRYLESMAGKLSHELRTPVSVVRSSLENLQMIPEDHPDRNTYIQRAHEGIERLSNIINRMSEATRLEQTLQGSVKETFLLNSVIRGCVDAYRSVYPGQVFTLQESAKELFSYGSPDFIAQMMDKLVSNAVDFSEPGKPIEIQLVEEQKFAVISVSNHGPVLPDQMQQHLFDSMVSLRSKKTAHPHLGLGLYIVRLITDFHDGEVAAENLPDDKGVKFIVRLPIQYTEDRVMQ